jgi:hypothetical protein
MKSLDKKEEKKELHMDSSYLKESSPLKTNGSELDKGNYCFVVTNYLNSLKS